jgi:EAL domain-containing protein (putative c-di-GMP-specific phosphodiesterase class I)
MTNLKHFLPSAERKTLPREHTAFPVLNESEFVPFFQPLVTLRTGQLAGFEVLARWRHPTEGIIMPDRFIARVEQEGWIDQLTRQILEKAFAAAAILPDDLTLSINISPFQLRDSHLPEAIFSLAKDAGFSLSRLIVEITESALIENLESAAAIVAELKANGCRLALDDFGTGYSSQLRELDDNETGEPQDCLCCRRPWTKPGIDHRSRRDRDAGAGRNDALAGL